MAVLAATALPRPTAGTSAAPAGELCVDVPAVVVLGMTVVPAQHRCVPTP